MTTFRFTNDHNSSGAADIVDVLRKPRLWVPTEHDYPNHNVWLDKTEAQIISGEKRAMAAYMGEAAIGTVIYQNPADQPDTIEIRNISVATDARGRYVGAFLLRNAEIEAAKVDYPDVKRFIVDTKIRNTEMVEFLKSQGYTLDEVRDLYGLDAGLDAIMSKPAPII